MNNLKDIPADEGLLKKRLQDPTTTTRGEWKLSTRSTGQPTMPSTRRARHPLSFRPC